MLVRIRANPVCTYSSIAAQHCAVATAIFLSPTSSCKLSLSVIDVPSLPILSNDVEAMSRSSMHLARLRQTKIGPVQASRLPKLINALSSVCPCDLRAVNAHKAREAAASCI